MGGLNEYRWISVDGWVDFDGWDRADTSGCGYGLMSKSRMRTCASDDWSEYDDWSGIYYDDWSGYDEYRVDMKNGVKQDRVDMMNGVRQDGVL